MKTMVQDKQKIGAILDETKFSLKLHSIVLLVGPDGSGKSSFVDNILIPQLKAQGSKSVKHINLDSIVHSLMGDTVYSKTSIEAKKVHTQAEQMLFSMLDCLTQYPVSSEFVVVDATSLDVEFRAKVLEIAEKNHYSVSAILFDLKNKGEYSFDGQIPHGQVKAFKRVISGELLKKDYATIDRVISKDFSPYEITIADFADLQEFILPYGPEYVVFGDIHGCYEEFVALLKKQGFEIGADLKVTHPEGKRVVLAGDLVDKGYAIKEVVELAYANIGNFYMVIGNHENFVYKVLKNIMRTKDATPEVKAEFFNSIALFEVDLETQAKFIAVFEAMKNFYVHKNFIVTHAPCDVKFLGKISTDALKATRDFRYPKERDYEDHSEFVFALDERIAFLREQADVNHPVHIFGHVMNSEVSKFKNKVNIDTGCVAGNALSCVIVKDDLRIKQDSVSSADNDKVKKYPLIQFFFNNK